MFLFKFQALQAADKIESKVNLNLLENNNDKINFNFIFHILQSIASQTEEKKVYLEVNPNWNRQRLHASAPSLPTDEPSSMREIHEYASIQ